jgi:hypothetical protein
MIHLREFEEFSEEDFKDVMQDLESLGFDEEEIDMKIFIKQFGGGMSPEEYAETLSDYYLNPEEYGIDREGDYYDMIWYLYENSVEDHARFDLRGPMRMGSYDRWDTEGIAKTDLYKLYIKMSK